MNGFSFRRLVGVTLVIGLTVLGFQWTGRGVAMASPIQSTRHQHTASRSLASSRSAPSVAVPKAFKANSITWLTSPVGWVLGAAPCGKKTCSDVLGTTNGAKSWTMLGTINAPIAIMGEAARPGITQMRFATRTVGWAYEPGLHRTTNGGRSWASMTIPGGGKQILDLASNAKVAYAVVSTCAWMTGECNQRPLTLWRTTSLTGNSWTRIPLDLPS